MLNGSPRFQTTLWSAVMLIAREPASSDGRAALEALCRDYWYPVYAFVRRQGATTADAQDLTQSFFAHILKGDFFDRADPEMGRFRNFLLGALRNFLSHEWARRNTQRQGGTREKIPIDAEHGELLLRSEPTATNDATRAFDRAWAHAILDRALTELATEHRDAGKAELFSALKGFLEKSAEPGDYDAIALRLRMTKGAVAAAVHRMNRRLGELVRHHVRETVGNAELAEEELRFLFDSFGT